MATLNISLNKNLRILNLCAGILLILNGLIYMPLSHAQPTVKEYKLPAILLEQLKIETEQRRRGECENKNLELFSESFYALADHKLLVLIGLPDYFCHSSSFMPVTIDSQGHWQYGSVIESRPSELFTDTQAHQWLLSYFENEAVFPYLHHSTDGIHWQEINLPKPAVDCCFVYIKQICVSDSKIQLKFTGIDETQPEYWQTELSDSLTTTPHWQKLASPPPENPKQCQNKLLNSGDWQRKLSKNNREVVFQSVTPPIKVIIPRWLK